MRSLIAAAVVVAATAAGPSQSRYIATNIGQETTCHAYDPAKLTVVEKKLSGRQGTTDGLVWRVMRDDGLIMATVATKEQADAALAAIKKFTSMCVIGRSPLSFTYFER